jgi:hypothetical protein
MVNAGLPGAIAAWHGSSAAPDLLRKNGRFERQSIPKQTARFFRKFLPHSH